MSSSNSGMCRIKWVPYRDGSCKLGGIYFHSLGWRDRVICKQQ
jgi:hypothetical protein